MAKNSSKTVDVTTLPRSAVRYAIFRMRSGNPEPVHEAIYAFYGTKLKPHGLDFTDFTIDWDVSLTDNSVIVSGLDLTPIKDKIEGSLFKEDGSLKDDDDLLKTDNK